MPMNERQKPDKGQNPWLRPPKASSSCFQRSFLAPDVKRTEHFATKSVSHVFSESVVSNFSLRAREQQGRLKKACNEIQLGKNSLLEKLELIEKLVDRNIKDLAKEHISGFRDSIAKFVEQTTNCLNQTEEVLMEQSEREAQLKKQTVSLLLKMEKCSTKSKESEPEANTADKNSRVLPEEKPTVLVCSEKQIALEKIVSHKEQVIRKLKSKFWNFKQDMRAELLQLYQKLAKIIGFLKSFGWKKEGPPISSQQLQPSNSLVSAENNKDQKFYGDDNEQSKISFHPPSTVSIFAPKDKEKTRRKSKPGQGQDKSKAIKEQVERILQEAKEKNFVLLHNQSLIAESSLKMSALSSEINVLNGLIANEGGEHIQQMLEERHSELQKLRIGVANIEETKASLKNDLRNGQAKLSRLFASRIAHFSKLGFIMKNQLQMRKAEVKRTIVEKGEFNELMPTELIEELKRQESLIKIHQESKTMVYFLARAIENFDKQINYGEIFKLLSGKRKRKNFFYNLSQGKGTHAKNVEFVNRPSALRNIADPLQRPRKKTNTASMNSKAEAEISKLKESLKAIQQEIASKSMTFEAELKEKQTELENCRLALSESLKKIVGAEKERKNAEEQIKLIGKELSDSTAKISVLELEIGQFKENMATLSSEASSKQLQIIRTYEKVFQTLRKNLTIDILQKLSEKSDGQNFEILKLALNLINKNSEDLLNKILPEQKLLCELIQTKYPKKKFDIISKETQNQSDKKDFENRLEPQEDNKNALQKKTSAYKISPFGIRVPRELLNFSVVSKPELNLKRLAERTTFLITEFDLATSKKLTDVFSLADKLSVKLTYLKSFLSKVQWNFSSTNHTNTNLTTETLSRLSANLKGVSNNDLASFASAKNKELIARLISLEKLSCERADKIGMLEHFIERIKIIFHNNCPQSDSQNISDSVFEGLFRQFTQEHLALEQDCLSQKAISENLQVLLKQQEETIEKKNAQIRRLEGDCLKELQARTEGIRLFGIEKAELNRKLFELSLKNSSLAKENSELESRIKSLEKETENIKVLFSQTGFKQQKILATESEKFFSFAKLPEEKKPHKTQTLGEEQEGPSLDKLKSLCAPYNLYASLPVQPLLPKNKASEFSKELDPPHYDYEESLSSSSESQHNLSYTEQKKNTLTVSFFPPKELEIRADKGSDPTNNAYFRNDFQRPRSQLKKEKEEAENIEAMFLKKFETEYFPDSHHEIRSQSDRQKKT